MTNVVGTQMPARRRPGARATPRYVQVSTDEVYGTLGPDDPPFTETTPLAPNSPYAASKAGADLLVRAAHHTHGWTPSSRAARTTTARTSSPRS